MNTDASPATPRTSRWRLRRPGPRGQRWLAVLLFVLAAIVVLIALWDWNWFKGPVERAVQARTGRVLAIGNLDGSPEVRPMLDTLNAAGTLADIAQYFYLTDLRTPELGNCGSGTSLCTNDSTATTDRGTPGRGREWERAIDGNFARVPLADQVEALQELGRRYPELDAGR